MHPHETMVEGINFYLWWEELRTSGCREASYPEERVAFLLTSSFWVARVLLSRSSLLLVLRVPMIFSHYLSLPQIHCWYCCCYCCCCCCCCCWSGEVARWPRDSLSTTSALTVLLQRGMWGPWDSSVTATYWRHGRRISNTRSPWLLEQLSFRLSTTWGAGLSPKIQAVNENKIHNLGYRFMISKQILTILCLCTFNHYFQNDRNNVIFHEL